MNPEDDIGERFAMLTGHLEDAAGLAGNGQSQQLSTEAHLAILADIQDHVTDACRIIEHLDYALQPRRPKT